MGDGDVLIECLVLGVGSLLRRPGAYQTLLGEVRHL